MLADRLKRVITGSWASGKVEPLPGGFQFVALRNKVDADANPQLPDVLRRGLAIHGIELQESGMEVQGIEGSHKEQWGMLNEGIGDAATLGAPWSIKA